LRLFRGERDLPATAASKVRTLIGFVQAFSPAVKSDVFQVDDAGPVLRELIQYTKALRMPGTRRARRPIAGGAAPSPMIPAGAPRPPAQWTHTGSLVCR
jgi:hypothetical protein